MKKKLDNLQEFLISNNFKKQAYFLQEIKKEYIDPYLDEAEEFIDPYLDKAKEYVDPYLDEAEEFIDPYLDKAKKYLGELVGDEEEDKSPQDTYHHTPSENKNDSKYKEWSSTDNPKYIGMSSNFSKVYGNNNYRSAKPINSKEFFEYLKEKYNISTIIDLMSSGEGDNVRSAGLEYVSIPMGNRPPTEDKWKLFSEKLRLGNCLVHCHHGADRTGAMIARWEIENNQLSNQEAYEKALTYGFKPEEFKYPGGNLDPNKHLREYIFESNPIYSKEMEDDEDGIFDKALSYGKGKIRSFIGDDSEDLPSEESDYADSTGMTPISPREIYSYLRNSIGMKENQALGIIANIYRESGYKPGNKGDGGQSWGLFQMRGSRRVNMIKDVPDWKTNWKGQINHAVYTDPSSDSEVMRRYLAEDFDSPGDAGFWFANKYERPALENRKSPSWYNSVIAREGFAV